jgi:hypothetical protein
MFHTLPCRLFTLINSLIEQKNSSLFMKQTSLICVNDTTTLQNHRHFSLTTGVDENTQNGTKLLLFKKRIYHDYPF